MKGRMLILAAPVILLALILLGGCSQPNKQLFYGTWINDKMATQKTIRAPDGKWDNYMPISDAAPFQRGTEQIVDFSTDSEGNLWYKTYCSITDGTYKGSKLELLQKINKTGTRLEFVWQQVGTFDPKSFPSKIDSTDGSYTIYYRAGEVRHIHAPKVGALSVYLPDDYNNSTASYPVLYLLHGNAEFGGDDLTFLGGGYHGAMSDANVAVIVDKLSQQGKIKPLIVACPDNFSPYVVSFVDTTFRTISKRESRAIAGHSMGGGLSVYTALSQPELFSIVGGFSSSLWMVRRPIDNITMQNLKSNLVLFWLYAGTNDQYNYAPSNRDFATFLRKNGVAVTYVEDDGNHLNRVAERLTEFMEYLSEHLKW